MKSHTLLLAILISTSCLAQNPPEPAGYDAKANIESLSGSGLVRSFDNRYQGIKGTPYLFEEWVPGEVFMKNKQTITIKEFNYNCYTNEVAYLDPSSKAVMLINKNNIEQFYMLSGADTLVFFQVQLEENAIPIFAQVLYKGESTLYRVYEKEFVKADYEGVYSAGRKYDEFDDNSDLYLSKPDDAIPGKVKKSKKQILAAFPEAEKELSAYMKAEKLNLKQEEDLVKLLKYFDSL